MNEIVCFDDDKIYLQLAWVSFRSFSVYRVALSLSPVCPSQIKRLTLFKSKCFRGFLKKIKHTASNKGKMTEKTEMFVHVA